MKKEVFRIDLGNNDYVDLTFEDSLEMTLEKLVKTVIQAEEFIVFTNVSVRKKFIKKITILN